MKDTRGAKAGDVGCACAGARQLARALTQLYDSQLRRAGIEAPQFALLMTLHVGGACSQSALGQRQGLDKTTVSRNLKVLARNGWVTFSDAADRRTRTVTLTAAGRLQLRRAKTEWARAQEALRSAVSADQWSTMFDSFQAISAAARLIQQTAGRPRPSPV